MGSFWDRTVKWMRWPEGLEQILFLSSHHSEWEGQQDWRETQATFVEDRPGDHNPGARKEQKQRFLSSVYCSGRTTKAQSWRSWCFDINISNNGNVSNSRNVKNHLCTSSSKQRGPLLKKNLSQGLRSIPVSILTGWEGLRKIRNWLIVIATSRVAVKIQSDTICWESRRTPGPGKPLTVSSPPCKDIFAHLFL